MSLYNLFAENVILPLSDVLLKRNIKGNLDFLMDSQWWSREKIIEYQNKRLRALILHSYENVPYYTNLFKRLKLTPSDFQTVKDLIKLPILTKSEIKKNRDSLLAKNIEKKDTMQICSSGSTGEPLCYFLDKKAYGFQMATNLRGLYWHGFRLGDKNIKISQNERNTLEKRVQDFLNRTTYVFSKHLTSENIQSTIDKIIETKPKLIYGYPDPLKFMADYIIRNNISMPAPKLINTSGNILFPENRKQIETAFGTKIADAYSCEGAPNLFQCNHSSMYHISMEYAITEVLNLNDTKAKYGRLITTNLHNYAMPFIRYDTQDFIQTEDVVCGCGRELDVVGKISGRDSDILKAPSGKYLIVHNFTGYFEYLDSIKQFQVRQEAIDFFRILIMVEDNFSSSLKAEIELYWKNYIGSEAKVIVDIVESIPLEKSGKRRFLIRDNKIIL